MRLVLLGLFLVCGCSSRVIEATGTSATHTWIEGLRVPGLDEALDLTATSTGTELRIGPRTLVVEHGVMLEYDLAAGAFSRRRRTEGEAVPLPPAPFGVWIQGRPLVVDGERLALGELDFGAFADGSRARFAMTGVSVDGARRGDLPPLSEG